MESGGSKNNISKKSLLSKISDAKILVTPMAQDQFYWRNKKYLRHLKSAQNLAPLFPLSPSPKIDLNCLNLYIWQPCISNVYNSCRKRWLWKISRRKSNTMIKHRVLFSAWNLTKWSFSDVIKHRVAYSAKNFCKIILFDSIKFCSMIVNIKL